MRVLLASRLRIAPYRTSLLLGISCGYAFLPLSAQADDGSAARLEQEMMRLQAAQAHVQQEQREIERDLALVRGELVKHLGKAHVETATAHSAKPSSPRALKADGVEAPARHGEPMEEKFADRTMRSSSSAHRRGVPETTGAILAQERKNAQSAPSNLANEDRVVPAGGGKSVLDVGPGTQLAVIGRRAEDIMPRLAENGVGPHPRETAGGQAAGALGDHGVFHFGPVTLILGGFVDTASVLENRHIASGTFNYWQDMPYPNQPRYHTNNFDGSARYSRLSLLARGNIDPETTISGFFESDFGSGAVTTDPYESNSYAFRLRQAYLAFDDNRDQLHLLAGQAWSMLTPGRIGIVARQESLPETIEASMLAGQTWSRQLQVRVVKDFFDHRLWAGISVENPATLYDTTGFTNNNGAVSMPNGAIATIGENGVGLTNDTANFSNEIAPDVIGKLAYDPTWGHYEVEGIMHFPHDRVTINHSGHNNTAVGGGGGGSIIFPVVPGKVEVRLAGLAGWGINRYGSVLLPDATLNAAGAPVPLFGVQAQAGVIAHPNKRIDVYGYFGTQRVGHSYFNNNGASYGYGNPGYSNAGCLQELSSLSCTANTRAVSEITLGAWWRFFKGRFGTVEGGTQLAYSRREIWSGVGGDPHTSMAQVFFDFRYLPFQ
ncbi:hypothetical protein A0U89_04150 [Kozakia baliensis]|uniref:Porin n=1 Tax=Kozakia baliensis TaxID=153496 RepID=A0A1D8UWS9_9PROT|nr:hypothetical protein A0U89_04150 [Kozakia baliensis]